MAGTTLGIVAWNYLSYRKLQQDIKKEAELSFLYVRLAYLQHHKLDLPSLVTSEFQDLLAQFETIFYGGMPSTEPYISNMFNLFINLTGSKREKVHAALVKGLGKLENILSASKERDIRETAVAVDRQVAIIFLQMCHALVQDFLDPVSSRLLEVLAAESLDRYVKSLIETTRLNIAFKCKNGNK